MDFKEKLREKQSKITEHLFHQKKKLCVCVFMCKMSSGAEELTQTRKITAEENSENKIRTICLNKRGVNELYVIWVKINNLQEICVFQCQKKLKVTAVQNILQKIKSRNTKEKGSMD